MNPRISDSSGHCLRHGFGTSGSKVEGESFVGAKAVGHEANLDFAGVGEEGRWGGLLPTKGPQVPRRSGDLQTEQKA